MKKILPLLALLTLTISSPAEVFTLWPWKRTEAGSGVRTELAALPGIAEKPLLREPVVVNGIRMELEVTRSTAGMTELLEFLSARLHPENLETRGNTLRVTFPADAGWLERWLLIDAGAGEPVTIFRLRSPEELPRATWPEQLPPFPPGATPLQTIQFPNRNGWYGAFTGANGSPEQLLRETSAKLTAAGWQAAAGEADYRVRGTGEIFLRERPRSLLWVVFDAAGNGSFFLRDRK